ncbi:MAG: IS3 family transposase [Hydrogenophaga sp.]|uniref:IS3 family transposase n=1 Tax=Hydrogenophaga sp. TaxID=1904254 RepID=UPI0027600825|nr:IS3 family transposase [Hydrogenophaga sp.]MDP2417539.1 IS3 family transposase [Hydrogenophaga sp.]MDZ4187598.1 IS3 family transposase [Hydrogenophaga sp.]
MTKAKTSSTRARYTLEFKREAVRLVEGGQSIAAAAQTLGVVSQTLFNWVKAQRQGKLTGADSKPVSAEQMEISRLRAELARVTMERDILGKSDGVLRKGSEVKYAFILNHQSVWPISVQCRVLKVSISGYHEHFVRRASGVQRRHLSDDALLVHIKAIHAQTHGAYGWPRIWKTLLGRGIRVGKERVQKLMKLHGIRAKGKRRFKVTTDSNHDLPISSNVLNREFTVAEPDKVWVGDITYIATDEGWLFLAVVIDLFSRQVVGWSLRENMTREIVMDALRMAWFRRHPGKQSGLIFHSDRGSQYASEDFRDLLKEYDITSSMSRRGNCWDNACSETLFGSLKVERLHGQRFATRRQAKDEVMAWLTWYNSTRMHSTLAYVSPMQFEKNWLAAQPKQASS